MEGQGTDDFVRVSMQGHWLRSQTDFLLDFVIVFLGQFRLSQSQYSHLFNRSVSMAYRVSEDRGENEHKDSNTVLAQILNNK